MLNHPVMEQMNDLKMRGMIHALQDQLAVPDIESMDFLQRLGLLLDREATERSNRRLQTRLKKAKLRQQACFEDIDFRSPRGLDKAMMLSLATGDWIKNGLNVLIAGATGTGKSYLGCALAHKACLEGYCARYLRMPRLMEDLAIARADGSYNKTMMEIARCDLIIIDDWGLVPMAKQHRHDLLEILEDRHGLRSTLVTSQLPVASWHEYIGDSTLADAILDRLIHNAYKINLKGGSMRKQLSALTSKNTKTE